MYDGLAVLLSGGGVLASIMFVTFTVKSSLCPCSQCKSDGGGGDVEDCVLHFADVSTIVNLKTVCAPSFSGFVSLFVHPSSESVSVLVNVGVGARDGDLPT